MDKQSKQELVKQLHDEFGGCSAVFVTDPIGMNVAEVTKLRRSIKDADGSYRVVKNTLLKIAAEGTPVSGLEDHFSGPTAVAMAQGDPLAVAKALVEFAKTNKKLELQGGLLGEKVLTIDDIKALAELPSRDELLAKMLGSINAPLSNFVGVMAAIPRQLLYVLKAIEQNKAEA